MSSMDHLDRVGNKTCRVIVHRARNLKPRGKDTKSSPFVTICLGKEKFATSVIEKSQNPEWNEDCELAVRPRDSKLEMSVLHQDFFLERFLGRIEIPLMEIEAAPKRSIKGWYKLQGKSSKGKKEDKSRGELEITAMIRGEETSSILQHVQHLPRLDIHPLRKSSSTPYIASTNPFDDDNSIASTDSQRSSPPVEAPTAPPMGISEPPKSPFSRLHPSSNSPTKEPSPLFTRHGMGRKIVRTSIRKEKRSLEKSPSLPTEPALACKPEPRRKSDTKPDKEELATPPPGVGDTQPERPRVETVAKNAAKKVASNQERGEASSPRPISRTLSEECLSKSAEKLEAERKEQAPTKKISYKPAARSARRAKATSQYYPPESPGSPTHPGSTSLPTSPVATSNGVTPLPTGEDTPDSGVSKFDDHPYQSLSKEELIRKVTGLESTVQDKDRQIAQQERYIDELLLKVITASPGILDQGYQPKPSIRARPPVQRYQARKQEVII